MRYFDWTMNFEYILQQTITSFFNKTERKMCVNYLYEQLSSEAEVLQKTP